jgi:hypothetical protein
VKPGRPPAEKTADVLARLTSVQFRPRPTMKTAVCECGNPRDPRGKRCRDCANGNVVERQELLLVLAHAGADEYEIAEATGYAVRTVQDRLGQLRRNGELPKGWKRRRRR